jgi:hypothetical protein
MRFFAILLVPLLVAAHANPAPGRSRGGSSSSAGSKDCITQSGVSFYAGNTTDISRGIYNSGVNVKLICYLTGQAVNQNT